MRSPFDPQLRLGSTAIADIPLNTRFSRIRLTYSQYKAGTRVSNSHPSR